jgi:hypothetical protein
MADASPTAERREQILGELAEWLHAAARDGQRRLLEAETSEEFERLSGSLCKLARGVRLSVLAQKKQEEARLVAEAKAAKAQADDEARAYAIPRHLRRVRIRAAVGRHVYEELEDDGEVEMFWADMNARLDELEGADDFLETPIETLVARLCRDLGVDPPEPPAPDPGPRVPAKAGDVGEGSQGACGPPTPGGPAPGLARASDSS